MLRLTKKNKNTIPKVSTSDSLVNFSTDEPFNDDRDSVLAEIQTNYYSLCWASKRLQGDYEVVLSSIKLNGIALEFASEELQNNKSLVHEAINNNQLAFQFASNSLKDDFDTALMAVRKEAFNFYEVSPNLQINPTIALTALRKNPNIFSLIGETLKADPAFILKVIKTTNCVLDKETIEPYANDFDIMLALVRKNGEFIQYASTALKDNKALILAASKQCDSAFDFVSKEIRNDINFMRKAIIENNLLLYYASTDLKNNRQFVLDIIEGTFGTQFYYVSDELKKDIEVAFLAVRKAPDMIEFVSPELKNNLKLVLIAVKNDASLIEHASKTLQQDRSVIFEGVKQDYKTLEYASTALRDDFELILEALKNDVSAIKYASDRLKKKDVIIAQLINTAIDKLLDPYLRFLPRKILACYSQDIIDALKKDTYKITRGIISEDKKNEIISWIEANQIKVPPLLGSSNHILWQPLSEEKSSNNPAPHQAKDVAPASRACLIS